MVKNVQNASPRGIISYCLTNLWPLKFRNAKMLQHHACDFPRLHGVQSRNLTIQFPWSPTSAASQVNKRIWDSVILSKNYGKTHGWKLKKMFYCFPSLESLQTLGIHSNLSYLAGLHQSIWKVSGLCKYTRRRNKDAVVFWTRGFTFN